MPPVLKAMQSVSTMFAGDAGGSGCSCGSSAILGGQAVKEITYGPDTFPPRAGLVYASLDAAAAFADVYANIEDIAGESAFAGLKHHTSIVCKVAANWKVYVDNFLEGYHLPLVHPGLTQLVDYSTYTTELDQWWSLQRSPVEDSGPYGGGEGLYFFIYPNIMLNFMPGRIQTNRVVPTSLTTCDVEFDFYYVPGAESRAAEDRAFTDQIQEEDRMICEHVQKGLTSGVYEAGRLSPKRESGVWHFQNLLRQDYRNFHG
ncbi:MAG: SRPBCC family protein [Halioglobus sp.]